MLMYEMFSMNFLSLTDLSVNLWSRLSRSLLSLLTIPLLPTSKQLRVALKSKPNEPIIDGKWRKKIHAEESFWNIERDGEKSVLQITMEKYEK